MAGAGVGARVDAVDLFLRFVLADSSEAAAFRLVPRWEPPPPKPNRAVPLDAVPTLPAGPLPVPPVGHVILTILRRGEFMGSVLLAPSESEQDLQNLKSGKGNCCFNIGIHPSDGQATVRFYDVDRGGFYWRSTGLCFMDSIANEQLKSCHMYSSVEDLFARDVHFFGGCTLPISFPPLRMDFKKHFKCESIIGSGTEGKVYICLSQFKAHPCSVKETHPEQFLIPYTGAEPTDVKILSMLNHVNIAEILLSWSEQKNIGLFGAGAIFTSMKLYARSLKHYLNGEEFNLEDRKYIFRQIMAGIEFMHQHHIVHRDIKPGNILIGENLCVKIVDFGIAKVNQPPDFLGFSSGCYGSVPYRAPEIVNAYKRHNEKVNELSKSIREGMQEFDQYNEDFNLDTLLDGTNILDGWRGYLPLLKRMVKPKEDERPSASEVLETLHLRGTGSDVQHFGFILH